jgi:hypothetical protein
MKKTNDRTTETDDLLFVKTFTHPLDDTLKVLLADVQRDSRCRNKVPVLEIEDGRERYLIVPRRRLRAVSTKADNAAAKQVEKGLVRLVKCGSR